MLELGVGEELSVVLVNAVLLALWPVLPGLLFSYIGQLLVARRRRPEFSLHKSEAIELDRATLLYEKVCNHLREINDQSGELNGFWRVLFGRRVETRQAQVDELEDLKAHADHLCVMIIRLKHQPFQRLRSWVHIKSSEFALGLALATHVMGLALLIVAIYVPERPAWGDELLVGVSNKLVWYPFDEHLFYANAIASCFAALAAPVFYLVRRAALRQEYGSELWALKEFANTDPGQVIDQLQSDPTVQHIADSSEVGADNRWFAVLGLSPTATIEEVKQAYKLLIKQNHPDRVYGMSPTFRKLAEAEAKKINAAYQHALCCVSPIESESGRAAN